MINIKNCLVLNFTFEKIIIHETLFSLPALVFLIAFIASAQFNIVSVADGSFKSPSIWNCNCLPIPVATIPVNHHVVFDSSLALLTDVGHRGKITVAVGASLLQDATRHDMFLDGSRSIIKNGKFYPEKNISAPMWLNFNPTMFL